MPSIQQLQTENGDMRPNRPNNQMNQIPTFFYVKTEDLVY